MTKPENNIPLTQKRDSVAQSATIEFILSKDNRTMIPLDKRELWEEEARVARERMGLTLEDVRNSIEVNNVVDKEWKTGKV